MNMGKKRKNIMVLIVVFSLLALLGLAWGDSFSFQEFGLSPSSTIGTLVHWKWTPSDAQGNNFLGTLMYDAHGGTGGSPFGGTLPGDGWKAHVNDPSWTKDYSVELLKYLFSITAVSWIYITLTLTLPVTNRGAMRRPGFSARVPTGKWTTPRKSSTR
jgi:hypothetical protein